MTSDRLGGRLCESRILQGFIGTFEVLPGAIQFRSIPIYVPRRRPVFPFEDIADIESPARPSRFSEKTERIKLRDGTVLTARTIGPENLRDLALRHGWQPKPLADVRTAPPTGFFFAGHIALAAIVTAVSLLLALLSGPVFDWLDGTAAYIQATVYLGGIAFATWALMNLVPKMPGILARRLHQWRGAPPG